MWSLQGDLGVAPAREAHCLTDLANYCCWLDSEDGLQLAAASFKASITLEGQRLHREADVTAAERRPSQRSPSAVTDTYYCEHPLAEDFRH